jgi:hypothetical protein
MERIVKNRGNYKFGIAGALAVLALCLTACPTESGGDDEPLPDSVISLTGDKGEMELTLGDGDIRFFDFATGAEVRDAAIKSREWDIAFWCSRQILTNSGITAAEYRSGGKGAVWHTEKTGFDQVVLEDAVRDDPVYMPYNEDIFRYAVGMTGYSERFMNVMTYLGYPNERDDPAMDGTTMNKIFRPMYLYDKRAFYEATVNMMPPDFRPTNRVYIIRHGDGEHYSKFQITKFVRDTWAKPAPTDTYRVIWENF